VTFAEEMRMEREALLFANDAFYRAFAARDIAAMERLWSQGEPVACIHPGWSPILGRTQVMASWRAILGSPGAPAIACRQPQACLRGDSALVICYEVIGGSFLVATNCFVREDGEWRMTHHHAGPVAAAPEADEATEAAIH